MKVKVQGPNLQDYYYKSKPSVEYTVQYWLDGMVVEQFETATLPDPKAYWRENFAHLYPEVDSN